MYMCVHEHNKHCTWPLRKMRMGRSLPVTVHLSPSTLSIVPSGRAVG